MGFSEAGLPTMAAIERSMRACFRWRDRERGEPMDGAAAETAGLTENELL